MAQTANSAERGGFVFLPSFEEAINCYTSIEARYALYAAIAAYGTQGTEPDFSEADPSGSLAATFRLIRQQLDVSKQNYAARVANGRKGGAPKGNRNWAGVKETQPNTPEHNRNITEHNQDITELNQDTTLLNRNITELNQDTTLLNIRLRKDKDKDKDKNKDKDNSLISNNEIKERVREKAQARFSPPALTDVKAYVLEKNLAIDAEQFWNYYEANGWKVGKNPMKNWRAALNNWARHEPEFAQRGAQAPEPRQTFAERQEAEARKHNEEFQKRMLQRLAEHNAQ